jgi:hypothetical protein
LEVLRKTGVTQQEATVGSSWLQEGEQIVGDFEPWNDDPFGYNETASVGILVAAAFKAGLLALPEYVASKGVKGNRRKRRRGRCDLWVASTRISWAFEFKQMILAAPPRLNTLEARLARAVDCASHVTAAEADLRVGCLIVSTYPASSGKPREMLRERLDEFKGCADFAAVIEPDHEYAAPTYFFMKHYKRYV